MIKEGFTHARSNKTLELTYDILIVGGGMAGVCAALAAGRRGCKVALIQDRPVLGGNASSEVRLWALGATSHMGNNNRWARESGILGEILVENVFRNKEGNAVKFDVVLIEKVKENPHIDLYLNTIAYHIDKKDAHHIDRVVAFNPQNSTTYHFRAGIFIDSSGDGIVSYQAGVPFRMGAESPEEFDEKFAPDVSDYGELLGHTLYFYSKKVDHPVKFIPPDFALKDIEKVTKIKDVNIDDIGTKFWWLEYGGRHDTIHETEEIKYELWKIVYGIWNHIKNSGKYAGAEYYTLEWVGMIPGKRESRRFEGEYMLNQRDIVEQKDHDDAISFGGWALDLHPADGAYSDKRPCSQYHAKGVYQIPYRCYVPKEVDNLLLAGRIISASHVAFGSTRVMLTCGHGGQAVGTAAAMCIENQQTPREYAGAEKAKALQQELLETGHYIPYVKHDNPNIAEKATFNASSTLKFDGFDHNGSWRKLNYGMAQMIPCRNAIPNIQVKVNCDKPTTVHAELRISSKPMNHTPDTTLQAFSFELAEGDHTVELAYGGEIEGPRYVFVTLLRNEDVSVAVSDQYITGFVSVFNKYSPEVNNYGQQFNQPDIGVEEFEFWTPIRRPDGPNMALTLDKPLPFFQPGQVVNGFFRPIHQPNGWVADMADENPVLTIQWDQEQEISSIKLFFDTDFDHAMETCQWPHPEDRVPYVVKDYRIKDNNDRVLQEVNGNYQTVREHTFAERVRTHALHIETQKWQDHTPVAIMGIICR